jgi:hypothetical protein
MITWLKWMSRGRKWRLSYATFCRGCGGPCDDCCSWDWYTSRGYLLWRRALLLITDPRRWWASLDQDRWMDYWMNQ